MHEYAFSTTEWVRVSNVGQIVPSDYWLVFWLKIPIPSLRRVYTACLSELMWADWVTVTVNSSPQGSQLTYTNTHTHTQPKQNIFAHRDVPIQLSFLSITFIFVTDKYSTNVLAITHFLICFHFTKSLCLCHCLSFSVLLSLLLY